MKMVIEEIFRGVLMFRKSWQIMKIELLSFCSDGFILCSEGELLLITVHFLCPEYSISLHNDSSVFCLHSAPFKEILCVVYFGTSFNILMYSYAPVCRE